jgi:predicted transglutaminase-like cysteine proteinase
VTGKIVIGVVAAALAVGGQALGAPRVPFATWARTFDRSVGPAGWPDFCRHYGDQCHPGDPARVQLGPQEWHIVLGINAQVNTSVRQVTDQDHWGQPESWDLPTDGRGDCEDFVLEKRRRLALAGFPTGALLVTVVRDRHGDGHAVLTLSTTRGDFVLDNLTDRVKPWEETSYVFDRRQSPTDPNVWLAMRPQAPQTTVAATQKP